MKEIKISVSQKIQCSKEKSKESNRIWKDIPLSLGGRINIFKMAILPEVLYGFHGILIKVPKEFPTKSLIQKALLKFIWTEKTPRIAKTKPRQQKQSRLHHNLLLY